MRSRHTENSSNSKGRSQTIFQHNEARMESSEPTLPFRVTTYKLNFHLPNSSREGLKERILRDSSTDVWCLQGVNLSKQLKSLPDLYGTSYLPGLAFVYNTARVQLIEKDSVNLVPPLLAVARSRPSVADSSRVSYFHLSKFRIFIGVAAYAMLPQPCVSSSSSTPATHVTTHRLLVVTLDFERFRSWGAEFQCSLLRVLCHQIWEDSRCYTKRWSCTHVCLAGSFFFTPGSLPYLLMTSLSGGRIEDLTTRVIVPPFTSFTFDNKDKMGEVSGAAVGACVVVAEARCSGCCYQLLGVQVRRDSSDGALVSLSQLRLSVWNPATGDYDAEEGLVCGADGWWTAVPPRDTSAADELVVRLEWSSGSDDVAGIAEVEDGAALCFCLRVRCFGLLTPQRQDADGLLVGETLMCSATAHTVSADEAAVFCADLQKRLQLSPHMNELCNEQRQAFGEPVVTALYRSDSEVPSDCYDYIFVSTFTGVTVQGASRLTMADFEAETATAHLPVSCVVAVPCVVR